MHAGFVLRMPSLVRIWTGLLLLSQICCGFVRVPSEARRSAEFKSVHSPSCSRIGRVGGDVILPMKATRIEPTPATAFNRLKAIKLAAFAFAVYGDPTSSRWFRTADGADIGFQMDSLVRRNFHSMLLVHLVRAKGLPEEKSLIERVLTGGKCDPYIVTEVQSSYGSDLAITKAVKANRSPKFYQRFFLYVEDPATAVLELTVKDQNLLKGDDVIGHCRMPLTQLVAAQAEGDGEIAEWTGWLDVKDPEIQHETSGKVEVELQLVAMGAEEDIGVEDPDDVDDDVKAANSGPQSVVEDIDWNTLAAQLGDGELNLNRYRLACFLNNEETETQGAIWIDRKSKEIVISFRGTQMDSWKDLYTDMLIIQEPLDGSKKDERLVHAGFRRAYNSIRQAVLQSIDFITKDLSGWTIEVTGHSLGGALATLMSYELAGLYPEMAKSDRLFCYNYGSPRVGNGFFCRDYDKRLGHAAYRVVNNLDVVARMPRGTKTPTLIEYDHCGKTVLLTTEDQGENQPKRMSVWIEGESEGECPLRKIDQMEMFVNTSSDDDSQVEGGAERGQFQMPSLAQWTSVNGTALSLSEMLKAASNATNLQAMMESPPVGAFTQLSLETDIKQIASDMFTQDSSIANMTSKAAESIGSSLGIDTSFVAAEMKMMESIFGGKGLMHHMEPSYYEVLHLAFAAVKQEIKDKQENKQLV